MEKAKEYLLAHLKFSDTYLLGLSGGPDSIALFHLLREGGWTFHVAHIDHGWRKESKNERKILENMCKGYQIPFHYSTIDKKEIPTHNLEEFCRQFRMAFFKKIVSAFHLKACLLGHQKNDQVETILKRIFEGSSLLHLGGIKEMSLFENMIILRPLLSVSKGEIIAWLKKKDYSYFIDPTNGDPKFTRGRMRTKILPYLEEHFGKGIEDNIYNLGRTLKILSKTLQERVDQLESEVKWAPFGAYFSSRLLNSPLEGEVLLRRLGEKRGLTFSHEEIQRLFDLQTKPEKKFKRGRWSFFVSKDHFFFLHALDVYEFSLKKVETREQRPGWKGLWDGGASVYLPEDEYVVKQPILKRRFLSIKTLSEWYRNHSIPIGLRSWCPVVWKDDRVVGEFLTDETAYPKNTPSPNHLLTLIEKKSTI